ncbi:MAG: hypothetical protein GY856_28120 [bacterium]|nr:hypothetical protein [bacterium]
MNVRWLSALALPLTLSAAVVILGGCGPGKVTNCSEFCERWPGTPEQTNCSAAFLEEQGHPLSSTLDCGDVINPSRCNACIHALGLKNEECAAVYQQCFLNPSRPEPAGQAGGSD